jgi:hypothetical protein
VLFPIAISGTIPSLPIAMRSCTPGTASHELAQWLEEVITLHAPMSIPPVGIARDRDHVYLEYSDHGIVRMLSYLLAFSAEAIAGHINGFGPLVLFRILGR